MKIQLKKRLWNYEQGTVIEVDDVRGNFAINKHYAELVPEKIEPKKAEIADYKTKVEPEVKKLRNKRNANN